MARQGVIAVIYIQYDKRLCGHLELIENFRRFQPIEACTYKLRANNLPAGCLLSVGIPRGTRTNSTVFE